MERNSPLAAKLIADGLKPRQEAAALERMRDAAPQMLEALQDAQALFALGVGAMTLNGDSANQERCMAEAKAVHRRVIAAIRRATGQTQERAA